MLCLTSPIGAPVPPVDEDDDVVDVETRENVAGAAAEPRGELGCNDDRQCDGPDALARWEFELDRRCGPTSYHGLENTRTSSEVGITSIARPDSR